MALAGRPAFPTTERASPAHGGTPTTSSRLAAVRSSAPEISYFDVATNTWTSLGGLGAKLDQGYSNGYGVSANGEHIVGSAYFLVPEIDRIRSRAISWSEGDAEVTNLGSSVVDRASQARAVSDDGSVIVGYQDGVGRNAAVWVDGVQTFVLTETTEAQAVSSDGNFMVGGLWHSYPGDYNTNSRVDLADYTVWRDSKGSAAPTLQNDTDGGVLRQAQYDTWKANFGTGHIGSNSFGPNEAWRWSKETGIEALGCLNNDCGNSGITTAVFGRAVDVNHDGSVILGFDRGGNDGGIAGGDGWIWQAGVGLTALRDYFVAEGLMLDAETTNFSFGLPLAMSADGRTFVGKGQDPDQPGEFGWIVTLPPLTVASQTATIPEPSALVMAIGVAAILSAWRYRDNWSSINQYQ